MPKEIALLTLHGMGETSDKYYVDLVARVSKELDDMVGKVDFQHVYYQQILQPNQKEVWGRMDKNDLRYDNLRKFVLFALADASGLEARKDENESAYEESQIEIAKKLWAARKAMKRNGPLVVIAQSLGGQVFSNYVWDAQRAAGGATVSAGIWKNIDSFAERIKGAPGAFSRDEIAFLGCNSLVALITTGCNIPVFVAAHKQLHIRAISKPTDRFEWINFYDRDDVLGWPLRPLNGGYEVLVDDRAINAGKDNPIKWIMSGTPMSHTLYWEDSEVVAALARMIKEGRSKPVSLTRNHGESRSDL
ncbi:MAG TPA: hypothetical protein VEC01_14955 [Noviherbaspirillum sp.]|uniref:hypothetical protein n=1 Tax=Noviherbaspirillum sp. TaxID=1926288 RepID=UPI002D438854|nr:hypothetical protein [Noviherbaspirillum sp.]HYD96626.1 hypothetical protein [Noviherbaspirillum sp.]